MSRIHRWLNKDAPFHRAIERVGAFKAGEGRLVTASYPEVIGDIVLGGFTVWWRHDADAVKSALTASAQYVIR